MDNVYDGNPGKQRKWWSILGCFALLILFASAFLMERSAHHYVTAEGVLAVRAYALDDGSITTANSRIMEPGVELPESYVWKNGLSSIWGLPMQFFVEDKELDGAQITWEITVSGGECYTADAWTGNDPGKADNGKDTYLGDHFFIENNTLIQWTNFISSTASVYEGETTYIDAVIRADGNIVGYAIIKLCGQRSPLAEQGNGGICCFAPILVKSEFYPKVEGDYQNVTEDYIIQQIRKAKK